MNLLTVFFWIKQQQVIANDYNPNVMSPTEKRLLETSLVKDGYTQPVVVLPIQQSKINHHNGKSLMVTIVIY